MAGLCSFGPVSNGRYRELLAEAKRRQGSTWPPFHFEPNRGSAPSTVLEQRFAELTRGMVSVHERLAASHAILRAHGAIYLTSYPDAATPIDKIDRGLVLGYVHNRSFNVFELYLPRDRFYVRFWAQRSGSMDVGEYRRDFASNEFSFHYSRPNLFYDTGEQPGSEVNPWCPPVPSEQWAEKFLKSLRATTIR